jgi:hypothetical protein
VKQSVRIPVWLAAIFITAGLGAFVGTQGWMLREIASLKESVSGLSVAIHTHLNQSNTASK